LAVKCKFCKGGDVEIIGRYYINPRDRSRGMNYKIQCKKCGRAETVRDVVFRRRDEAIKKFSEQKKKRKEKAKINKKYKDEVGNRNIGFDENLSKKERKRRLLERIKTKKDIIEQEAGKKEAEKFEKKLEGRIKRLEEKIKGKPISESHSKPIMGSIIALAVGLVLSVVFGNPLFFLSLLSFALNIIIPSGEDVGEKRFNVFGVPFFVSKTGAGGAQILKSVFLFIGLVLLSLAFYSSSVPLAKMVCVLVMIIGYFLLEAPDEDHFHKWGGRQ